MIHFLGQFVPAHLVPDAGPHPPLHGVGSFSGQLPKGGGLRDRIKGLTRLSQILALVDQGGQLTEVSGHGSPPAPVTAEYLSEAGGVDEGSGARGSDRKAREKL